LEQNRLIRKNVAGRLSINKYLPSHRPGIRFFISETVIFLILMDMYTHAAPLEDTFVIRI
jgi:hypothetical protein